MKTKLIGNDQIYGKDCEWPRLYAGYLDGKINVIFLVKNLDDKGVCIFSSCGYEIGEGCSVFPAHKEYQLLNRPITIEFVP